MSKSKFLKKIEVDSLDSEDIRSIKYKPKGEIAQEKTINPKEAVYIKVGGTETDINIATNGLHCSLTACENFSRAYYDLRTNSHYFSKLMPNWKFDANDLNADQDSQAIKNATTNGEWEIGRGYAGKAEFRLVGPETTAHDTLLGDMLSSLKIVSTNSGIPVHWLSYPELMSNRATADNLLEVTNYATIEDRNIWEEGLHEIIEKAMTIAVNNGANPGILGDFVVKLPLISLANLKQLIEVYWPLKEDRVISMAYFRNLIPGINPEQEKKKIEEEQEEDAENSLMQNQIINQSLDNMQNQNEEQEGE